MGAQQVLQQVLGRADLSHPDGRPLWEYSATDIELTELLDLFRNREPCTANLSLHEQAALALVVSHVLCNSERSPPWSWKPVWDTLGWPDDSTAPYDQLETGLRQYWRRAVRRLSASDRRTFLGTFFVEGGLPRGWLDTTHDVGRAIRRLVSLCELHEAPASMLSAGQLSHLAEGLRCEELEELCSQVADTLVELRSRLPPACADPGSYLDATDPGWRTRLPLRISRDSDCTVLIGALLSVASSGDNAPPLLDMTTFFDIATGTCRRRLRISDRITSEQLAAQTGLAGDHGRMLYLTVQTQTGVRHQVARLESRAGEAQQTTWFVAKSSRLPELDATEPVLAAIVLRGDVLAQFVPVGAETLAIDAPWVFSNSTGRNPILLGNGSCATRHERALVFAPLDGCHITAEDEASTFTAWSDSLLGRCAYEVAGRVRFEIGEDSYLVETGASESTPTLILRGPRMAGVSGIDAPFAGAPQLLVLTERGMAPIATRSLSWRPVSQGGPWRSWETESPLGNIQIRCDRAQGSWLRSRACVVPAQLRMASGAASKHVRLFHRDLVGVRSLSPAVTVQRDAANGFFLQFDDASPSADAEVSLAFRNVDPVRLTVAVPGREAGFIDERGQWMPPGARVTIDELDRLRARAGGQARVQLEARASASAWERLIELRRGVTGTAELYLADIQDELTAFLRSNAHLDEYVEIRVAPLGCAPDRMRTLQVGNYGLWLYVESQERGATFSPFRVNGDRLREVACADLSLSVMSLAHPEIPWKAFARSADHWYIPFDTLTPGPYLGILQERGAVCGRPRVFTVPGKCEDCTSAFSLAATVPSASEREAAWRRLCGEMAGDWNHPDWNQFRALIRFGSPLPASSFEAMQAGATDPDFVAVALLREASIDGQREVMREFEEAGVFWPGLPLTSWIAAVNGALRAVSANPKLADLLGGHERAVATICPLLDLKITWELPLLSVIRSLAMRALSPGRRLPERGLSVPPLQLKALLHLAAQALVARHVEDEWPQPAVDFQGATPEEVAHVDQPGFRHAILRAPYFAARAVLRGDLLPRTEGRAYRSARAFDSEWFDAAHSYHLAMLIQQNVAAYEELFDR